MSLATRGGVGRDLNHVPLDASSESSSDENVFVDVHANSLHGPVPGRVRSPTSVQVLKICDSYGELFHANTQLLKVQLDEKDTEVTTLREKVLLLEADMKKVEADRSQAVQEALCLKKENAMLVSQLSGFRQEAEQWKSEREKLISELQCEGVKRTRAEERVKFVSEDIIGGQMNSPKDERVFMTRISQLEEELHQYKHHHISTVERLAQAVETVLQKSNLVQSDCDGAGSTVADTDRSSVRTDLEESFTRLSSAALRVVPERDGEEGVKREEASESGSGIGAKPNPQLERTNNLGNGTDMSRDWSRGASVSPSPSIGPDGPEAAATTTRQPRRSSSSLYHGFPPPPKPPMAAVAATSKTSTSSPNMQAHADLSSDLSATTTTTTSTVIATPSNPGNVGTTTPNTTPAAPSNPVRSRPRDPIPMHEHGRPQRQDSVVEDMENTLKHWKQKLVGSFKPNQDDSSRKSSKIVRRPSRRRVDPEREKQRMSQVIQLSPPLQAVVSQDHCVRGELEGMVWAYARRNNLQLDYSSKPSEIVCDSILQELFGGKERVLAMELRRLLRPHYSTPYDLSRQTQHHHQQQHETPPA